MNLKDLKTALAETLPLTMYYRDAIKLRQKGGRPKKRVSARAEDNLLILEAMGHTMSDLTDVHFTFATDYPPILQRNIKAVERVANELCGPSVAGILWEDRLSKMLPFQSKAVDVTYQVLDGIPLAFLKLKRVA